VVHPGGAAAHPRGVDVREEIIARDEDFTVEFKSTARWDLRESRRSKVMVDAIVKTVAGTLLINALGHTPVTRTRARIAIVEGKEVCRVDVAARTGPVWAKTSKAERALVARLNNSTRPIPEDEVDAYIAEALVSALPPSPTTGSCSSSARRRPPRGFGGRCPRESPTSALAAPGFRSAPPTARTPHRGPSTPT
jgi:hypothetical protein